MGKLVSIETFERFETLWNNSEIDLRSLTFILDTGQLYTHGIFLNSVVYGEEASGAVPVTIAGVTKTLALSSHNHDATYYKKTENINIGTYKLVSGEKELIYLSNAKIYVGDTTLPILIQSNGAIKSYRDLHEYTMLDTGNFSIENKTTTNYTLSNVATIKYGSNSFQLDYIKRLNTSSTFDTLSAYTSAGTTLVNGTLYGFMTFYTDGTTLNPSWAQLRIDIPNKTLEIRTSASTNWAGIPTGSAKNIKVNNTDYALLTTESSLPTIWAPTALGTAGYYLTTSDDGNSLAWRANPNVWNAMIGATDSANGTVGYINAIPPKDGYNTKYWRADGTWSIPTNTTYKLKLNNAINGDSINGVSLGSIYAPTSNGTGFLKGTAGDNGAITWIWDNTTYVPTSDYSLITITKNISYSGGWTDTGISSTDLGTGTYVVQVYMYYADLGMYASFWSGVMSWYANNTNQNRGDEILLHCASHYTGSDIYLRTLRTTSGVLKLLIACDTSFSSKDVQFKFRKLI